MHLNNTKGSFTVICDGDHSWVDALGRIRSELDKKLFDWFRKSIVDDSNVYALSLR